MRETTSREANGDGPLNDAVRRLDRALATLESSLRRDPAVLAGRPAEERLAAELQSSRARERALEQAAAAASDALGRAAAEVRTALGVGEDLNEEEAA